MIIPDEAGLSPAEWIELCLNRVIAAAMADAALHRRLKDDPAAVLAEHGFTIAAGVTVSVEEVAPEQGPAVIASSTDTHLHLPLPPPTPAPTPTPGNGRLSDDDLDAVVGGATGAVASFGFPFAALACFPRTLAGPRNGASGP